MPAGGSSALTRAGAGLLFAAATLVAAGAANFQATESLYPSFGYRHLHIDHDSSGTSLKTSISGPILGATLRF